MSESKRVKQGQRPDIGHKFTIFPGQYCVRCIAMKFDPNEGRSAMFFVFLGQVKLSILLKDLSLDFLPFSLAV